MFVEHWIGVLQVSTRLQTVQTAYYFISGILYGKELEKYSTKLDN